MKAKIGKITKRGHRAHTSIPYLKGGNPLAGGGNLKGGRRKTAAPGRRARQGAY